ncbi:probable BOI-related E3 ubiquitin-protein ligase 3 [Pyrus communis]|uniref:probable BOI-related E3 ubiquitin-protein ligase 3 n=1 Tax=Pyrus communis TaxID=23211 RepID=UPI0035C1B41D
MAVEARHLNLFPSQLIPNREMMNQIQGNSNLYNTQIGYGVPLSTGGVAGEALPPTYNSVIADSIMPPKTSAMKSDSGLTYNVPITLPRKRSRDSIGNGISPSFSHPTPPLTNYKNCGAFSFLGEDISLHVQQQQFDVDRLISQHMEKVRLEVEEKRNRQARRIIDAIEVGVVKRLRAKEEEIQKIGKLNWALEERVKSLCMENQIWRDLAQTNEATANALRTNLEQVLAHQAKDDDNNQNDANATALMDDAQSCCGSSGGDEGRNDGVVGLDGWRTVKGTTSTNGTEGPGGEEGTSGGCRSSTSRWCRSCGTEEACVLLLPCRHLCLCTVCGSSLHTCPICKSPKNASVHVNMS